MTRIVASSLLILLVGVQGLLAEDPKAPEPPKGFDYVERKIDSIKITVTPADASVKDLWFRVASVPAATAEFVQKEAEISKLTAWQKVTLSLYSCANKTEKPDPTKADDFVCSTELKTEATSNTDAPSAVLSPVRTETTENKIAVFSLTWAKPSTPNGPIDGYYLYVSLKNDTKIVIPKQQLPATPLNISRPIPPDTDTSNFVIEITAFNKDLSDNSEHESKDKATFGSGGGSWLIPVIIVAVVLVLGGVGAFFFMRSRGSN